MASENPATVLNGIEGLWSGSWGSSHAAGVVHQPVKADLFIQGNRVECAGFPDLGKLAGTVRIDVGAKQIQITPAAEAGDQPAGAIVFADKVDGHDCAMLIDRNKRSIDFSKVRVNPLAEVRVEFFCRNRHG